MARKKVSNKIWDCDYYQDMDGQIIHHKRERAEDKFIAPMAAWAAASANDMKNASIASVPGGIERQEKAGQANFEISDRLPIKGLNTHKSELEKMGFKFGKNYDKLFIEAILPEGWKKKSTDHSYYTDLLDEKGRKRASIFYKAAFYDTDSFITFSRRFSLEILAKNGKQLWELKSDYTKQEELVECYAVVLDCGKKVFKSALGTVDKRVISLRGANEYAIHKEAEAWLKANYPDYDNPMAHWSDK